jgi:hypothetical protein
MNDMTDSRPEVIRLLVALKSNIETFKDLAASTSSHWGYEDSICRFYHRSFKVYNLQRATISMVEALKSASNDGRLNKWFTQIIDEGTGKSFSIEANNKWLDETRPIIEAFFHAKFFVEMATKYGQELEEPPSIVPSGWAALLYLYNLRY